MTPTTTRGPYPARLLRAMLLPGLLALLHSPALADKTDVIRIKTGDRITGEIKGLDFGVLSYSTDYMSTVSIEWIDVLTLVSKDFFQVEDEHGNLVYGTLSQPSADRKLLVQTSQGPVELETDQVVRIAPIKQSVWDRIDGSMSLGANYTKSSGVGQFTFTMNANYRTRQWLILMALSSIITAQKDTSASKRQDLSFTYKRFLPHKWFWEGSTALQQNVELGIEARVLLGGSFGRHIVQSDRSRLDVSLGLSFSNEIPTGGDPPQQSLEAMGGLSFFVFKFTDPKTDLTSSLIIYPSLTIKDRFRVEFNTTLTQDLVGDFDLNLNVYDSYDNKPPGGGQTNDYGVVLSLGWSY